MKRLSAFFALMISAFACWHTPARADEWPSRPVRIICTFAAGGAADILSRIVAEHLSTVFHQQFFVETRAGAAGVIGAQAVSNTAPDGYNFVLVSVSLLSLIPVENPRLGFDPKRDLTNVAYVAGSPVVLSVNATSGMKTLSDFVTRAKASDKPLTYSSSGLGSMGHLVAEMFARKIGAKFEHVPYKGASQGLADLVGGHIMFSAQTVSSTSAQLKAGALIGLAQTGKERLPDFPAIPTFAELGHGDVASTVWFSLAGPAGLPPEIVQKVNREVVRVMTAPQNQDRLSKLGVVADGMSPQELDALVAAETTRWKPVLDQLGLVEK